MNPPSDTADNDDQNRRRAPRQRTLKGARLIYGNFSITCECTIRNLSATGARLRVDRTIGIPSEFYLLLPSEMKICRARISWHKGEDVGVEFLEPMRNPKLDPDPRIARLAYLMP